MANDLNLCQFIGRLGRDPEVRHTPSGDAVATFSIACGSTWKDKNSGEKKESTEWVNIVAWRKLGEICGEYLKKGAQVYISGKMQTRKWQDKEGNDRYTTEVIAESMQMLGGKREGSGDPAPRESNGGGSNRAPEQRAAPKKPSGNFDDFDDDIPF